MAWLPFGAGPRICIGMRLALFDMKILLASMMQKFEFVQCKETKVAIL